MIANADVVNALMIVKGLISTFQTEVASAFLSLWSLNTGNVHNGRIKLLGKSISSTPPKRVFFELKSYKMYKRYERKCE